MEILEEKIRNIIYFNERTATQIIRQLNAEEGVELGFTRDGEDDYQNSIYEIMDIVMAMVNLLRNGQIDRRHIVENRGKREIHTQIYRRCSNY